MVRGPIWIVLVLFLIARHSFAAGLALYPDPKFTPGVADPRVTQATIGPTICTPGYTKTVRNVPTAVRDSVFAAYNVPLSDAHLYELDHFISLELGGTNDAANLWPQLHDPNQAQGADQKDQVENDLHSQVCGKFLTLAQAQHIISTDWYAYYQQMQNRHKRAPASAARNRP